MRGSYAYVGADGLPYMIDWFADDDGFYPSVPHPSNYVELVTDHASEVVLTEAFDQAVESFKGILDDEYSLDEVFSISGNDLPAYGDEVNESQLF